MVYQQNDASEQAAGTTLTTGNTSFNTVVLTGSPTVDFSAAQVYQGYLSSYHIVCAGSGSSQCRFQTHFAASDTSSGEIMFYLNSLPGAICKIAAVLDTAFSQKFTFVIQASNRLSLNGLTTMTYVLLPNTWYSLRWLVTKGADATSGQCTVGLFLAGSQTPVETVYVRNNIDTGTNQFVRIYTGVVDTNGKFDGYVQVIRHDNAYAAIAPLTVQASERVGVIDAVTIGKVQNITISESIGVIDLPGPQVISTALDISELIGVTDKIVPYDFTNLLARWRADDIVGVDQDQVSSWSDVDGLWTPLSQTDPASQPLLRTNSMNGHKVVQFDGGNDFLQMQGTALLLSLDRAALTVFVAYKLGPTQITSGSRDVFSMSDGDNVSQHRMSLYSHSTTLHTLAGGRRLDDDNLQTIEGLTTLPGNKQGILCAQFGWSTRELYLYEDGIQTASSLTFQTAGNTSPTPSLAGAVGSRASGAGEYFYGNIAEILVFNTLCTPAQRTSVQKYLTDTYGFPSATTGVAMTETIGVVDGLDTWDPNDPVLSKTVVMSRARSVAETVSITDSVTAVMNGGVVFPPPLSGVGSIQDQFYQSLSAYGLNESIMYRWRKALIQQLAIADTGQSTTELEYIYLKSLGYSGSLADMRKQAGLTNFPSAGDW
jgi:transposase-like protein